MIAKLCVFLVVMTLLITIPAAGSQQSQEEEGSVQVLPPPSPHRVYVVDPDFPHLTAGKTYVVDGDSRQLVGQISAGYVFNFLLGPNPDEVYVTETYWSRGTRGERTDLVTIYSSRQLAALGEVVLPRGRFLVVTKKHNVDITPDGQYLLSFNMDPRTTVSVVDIKNRKYVGEIEVPGCGLVFSFASNSFSMVCADGSLLTMKFDAQAKATASRTKTFFDPKKDPVFEHPAVAKTKGRLLFISYEGMLHPVDLSSRDPGFEEPWSLLTDEDRQAGWRPGGWQLAAIHQGRNRLYVLMHQGGKWTAKQAGTEVWVFDTLQKKRVGRLRLDYPSKSVAVSQDERPQLYLLLSEKAALQTYDAESLHALGITEDLGDSPLVLHVQGD